MARVVLREGFYAQACFAAQQVAEKALKALAFKRGDRYAIGHSLHELVTRLESTYPQLSSHNRLARVLDQYYVPTRYPDALAGGIPFETYDEEQAQEAVEGAAAVVQSADSIITS